MTFGSLTFGLSHSRGGSNTPSRILQVAGPFAVMISGQKIHAGVPAATLKD